MPDSTALECLCKWESGICKDPPTHLGSLKTPAGRPLLFHAKEKLVTTKGGRASSFFFFIKYNRTEFVISTRGAAGRSYISTGIFHFDDTCHTGICFFSLVLEAISCPLGDLTKQMYGLTHVSLLFASHFLCYFLYLFSQVDIRRNEKVVCTFVHIHIILTVDQRSLSPRL